MCVETDNFFPFHGNGAYDSDLVKGGLDEHIIKLSQIKYKYIPSTVLPVEYFKKFDDDVYKTFENPKAAINAFIGTFGHDYKNKNKHIFTSNSEFHFKERTCNPNVQTKYLYANELNEEENETNMDIDKVMISDFFCIEKPVCYHMYDMKKVARTKKYEPEKIKLINIDEYDITKGKGVAITGPPGHGKSYTMNEIKKHLQPHQYRVAAPTHKAALNVDGETIYSLFNINVHNHTYLKSSADKLKPEGVKYIFIDEISMINSTVWAILRDIKKIVHLYISWRYGTIA